MTFPKGMIEILINAMAIGMIASQFWAARRLLAGQPLLPPRPPRSVPWTFLGVALVVALYLTLSVVVRLSYDAFMRPVEVKVQSPAVAASDSSKNEPGERPSITPREPSFTELMVLVSIVNGLAIAAIPWLLRSAWGATLEDLGLSPGELAFHARIGGVAFLLVTPWVYAVNGLALLVFPPSRHPMESMLRQEFTPAAAVLAVVSAVILAPASEELIFRGVFLGWLGGRPRSRPLPATIESQPVPDWEQPPAAEEPGSVQVCRDEPVESRWGEWSTIAASALPFALVHASEMPAPFPIFCLAMALGYLTRRTGSLVPALVLHGLFNGCSTVMILANLFLVPQGGG